MSSIGDAYADDLRANNIFCSGTITASHKVFGSDKLNQGQLHQHESFLYTKYCQVLQTAEITTDNGEAHATFNLTSPHNLSVGDTVHIASTYFSENEGDLWVYNIPKSELVGAHLVKVTYSASSFTIATTTPANYSGSTTVGFAIPKIKVDRYLYTDMIASGIVTWTAATTLPLSAVHSNTLPFYA